MADAITAIISALPPGVSPYDGLRAYFLSQVYHRTTSFDRGLYVIIGLCSAIFLGVVVSFLLRWRSHTLTWIIKDGAMTRPDFRVVCPALYAVFAAFETIQSVLILRAYRDYHWTPFGSYFQYLSLSAIVATGYILLGNILASTPVVRRVLMNIGSVNRSRGPMGIVVLNSVIVIAILASIGSLIPSALILGKHMPAQNEDVKDIFAVLATAEQANDLTLLSGLAGPVANLMLRGKEVQRAVQLAGWTTSAWLCGLWVGVGTIAYISLVRAVKARITKLERYVQDEETRQIETNMRYQQNHVELPMGKRAAQVQIQPKLSADKPFANLVNSTTEMPDKYENILSSQLSETSQKIRQLKAVLKRDIIDHILYLIMVLIFTSESILHSAGLINHIEPIKILSLVHSYLAAAFLSTALPLIGLFLYDGIKLFRQGGRHGSYGEKAFGGRTMPSLTFDIPLHTTRDAEKDGIDRPVGISVTQVHEVVVDSIGYGSDKDKDDDKYSSY